MSKKLFTRILVLAFATNVFINISNAQSDYPLSANAASLSKLENTEVNIFTGMPVISIPVYNYGHNSGLNLNISLDYFSGGIRNNETPSTTGLGWSLKAVDGAVLRYVRGTPDDLPNKGFLYSEGIPNDFDSVAQTYYKGQKDAQQDVFQFYAPGISGKFLIGKNKKIILFPISKLRIIYYVSPDDSSSIVSFTIINEQGIKYVFNEAESSTRSSIHYCSAWHLKYMVSPFGTDTIKFTYKSMIVSNIKSAHPDNVFTFFENTLVDSLQESSSSTVSTITKKISSITFPDQKKLVFVYDPWILYDGNDFALNSIHVMDSVFRYGFQFEWYYWYRPSLKGFRTYTSKVINPGYRFVYTSPYPAFGAAADTIQNSFDHWGFYNGAHNGSVRYPYVEGICTNGANREPSADANKSSLSEIHDPEGGVTYYKFENNTIYKQYKTVLQSRRINCNSPDTLVTNITTGHVVNSSDKFTLRFSNRYIFKNGYPFSGSGNMLVIISDTNNNRMYSTTVNLYDLFDNRKLTITCSNLPTGNYRFKTFLSGTTINIRSLFIYVGWETEKSIPLSTLVVGGIRIKQISHYDPITGKTDTLSTYKYRMTSGYTSGFSATIPIYDYPYETIEYVYSDTIETNYTQIHCNPLNEMSYTGGSLVGYKRVEVIKGSDYNNNGKEVYEFTDFDDANANITPSVFPFLPINQRSWIIGLPKIISVFNKKGRLIGKSVNQYDTINIKYTDTAFKSLKLGLIATSYIGHKDTATSFTNEFAGTFYYPETGKVNLSKTTKTIYDPVQIGLEHSTEQEFQYDSNYNLIKIISSYNKSKNLKLEHRIYYPYNYTIGGTIGLLRDSCIYTPVSSEDWITGDSIPRLLSASVTDFQQLPRGYIKPASVYTLKSNKPLPISTIGNFDSSKLVRDTVRIKKDQIFATYDLSGNCLEIKNPATNQSASEIYDYNSLLSIAKITNASSSDVAYTSFESDGMGNWHIPTYTPNKTASITGGQSYNLSSGAIYKSNLNDSIQYILTFWKKDSSSITVSNSSNNEILADQNGWKLCSQIISSTDSVSVSGTGIIDELRLYPKDANMVTYTFEPMIGITSTCSENNLITYNIYDSINRPVAVLDQNRNIIKKYKYHYNFTPRNFNSPDTVYAGTMEKNATTGELMWKCFYYLRYQDEIMNDETPEADDDKCSQHPEQHVFPID